MAHVQTIRAVVVKRSSIQTVRVTIKVTKVHPIYKKRYTQNRYYLVHDAADDAQVGQTVVIAPCRPISKSKTWQIVEKIDA
jgi:small subunit ribosomal protein S17